MIQLLIMAFILGRFSPVRGKAPAVFKLPLTKRAPSNRRRRSDGKIPDLRRLGYLSGAVPAVRGVGATGGGSFRDGFPSGRSLGSLSGEIFSRWLPGRERSAAGGLASVVNPVTRFLQRFLVQGTQGLIAPARADQTNRAPFEGALGDREPRGYAN